MNFRLWIKTYLRWLNMSYGLQHLMNLYCTVDCVHCTVYRQNLVYYQLCFRKTSTKLLQTLNPSFLYIHKVSLILFYYKDYFRITFDLFLMGNKYWRLEIRVCARDRSEYLTFSILLYTESVSKLTANWNCKSIILKNNLIKIEF